MGLSLDLTKDAEILALYSDRPEAEVRKIKTLFSAIEKYKEALERFTKAQIDEDLSKNVLIEARNAVIVEKGTKLGSNEHLRESALAAICIEEQNQVNDAIEERRKAKTAMSFAFTNLKAIEYLAGSTIMRREDLNADRALDNY